MCKTRRKIEQSQLNLGMLYDDIRPPCKAMEKIYYKFEEAGFSGSKLNNEYGFWVGIYLYDEQFKEIVQTR